VLSDSLSPRRFAGRGMAYGTPDHTTIRRFRRRLRESGLDEARFDAVPAQRDAQGLVLRKAALTDATLVEAAARRPARDAGAGAKADCSESHGVERSRPSPLRGQGRFCGRLLPKAWGCRAPLPSGAPPSRGIGSSRPSSAHAGAGDGPGAPLRRALFAGSLGRRSATIAHAAKRPAPR